MIAKCFSAAVLGIDAFPVEVEVNVTNSGMQDVISIVGLPDAAVRESRDRIKSALLSCAIALPGGTTIVNLAPADLRKEGAAFDLAIALGILAANGRIPEKNLRRLAVIGELALDGTIRPIKGALPIAVAFSANKLVDAIILPRANGEEAALACENCPVFAVDHLLEVIDYLNGRMELTPYKADLQEYLREDNSRNLDFADVKGQIMARRAMEIAASGGHNSLLIGPPGTGKSMISSRLPGILPPMTLAETLESSRIYSVLGMLADGKPLLNKRPFRAPHHTISDVGLIGGGKDPKPGEISLANHGVLFLDELPEFKRNVLEVLRQPLENGQITISRASGSCTFPARFMLCAAMNPCPCGLGEYELGCTCKIDEKRRYRKRISGPLLDRINLHVEVLQLTPDELLSSGISESSAVIAQRVAAARDIQLHRFRGSGIFCNASMGSRELRKFCRLDSMSQMMLRNAIVNFKLSPRAHDRILKVARTIADLSGGHDIKESDIFEAISYRGADRKGWD